MFARGSYEWLNQGVFNGFGAGNLGSSSVTSGGPNQQGSYNITTNWIYTFNPTTILNASVGWSHFNEYRVPSSEGTCPKSLGFPDSLRCGRPNLQLRIPEYQRERRQRSRSGHLHHAVLQTRVVDRRRAISPRSTTTTPSNSARSSASCYMNFTQLGQPDGQYSFNSDLHAAGHHRRNLHHAGLRHGVVPAGRGGQRIDLAHYRYRRSPAPTGDSMCRTIGRVSSAPHAEHRRAIRESISRAPSATTG